MSQRLRTLSDTLTASGIPASETGPDWGTVHVYRTTEEGPHLALTAGYDGDRYTIRTWTHYDGDLVLRAVDTTPAEAIAFAVAWWQGEAADLADAQAVTR